MVELQSGWQEQIDKPHGGAPFVWAFTIPLHVDATYNIVARVTQSTTPITIGGTTWDPWPMEISAMETAPEDVPSFQLGLGNHGRSIVRYLDEPGGVAGMVNRIATALLINTADTTAYWLTGFRIAGADASIDTLTLRMEPPNWFERDIPQARFNPRRCEHAFGGFACGYVINSAAAFTECPRTLDACIARGNDMASRNLGRPQPRNFGAFPAVAVS